MAGSIGLPVFEIVLARSLVLLVMSGTMLARRGAAAEWPWRSERCGGADGLAAWMPGFMAHTHACWCRRLARATVNYPRFAVHTSPCAAACCCWCAACWALAPSAASTGRCRCRPLPPVPLRAAGHCCCCLLHGLLDVLAEQLSQAGVARRPIFPLCSTCLQYLPLGDTAVLTFLAPVFVAAAAPLVLGERAGKGVALAMPLCVAGKDAGLWVAETDRRQSE